MQMSEWKMAVSYILGVVALGCLAAGIVSEVQNEDLGLSINSWYLIAIAVFVAAAWMGILRLRSPRRVRSLPPEIPPAMPAETPPETPAESE